MVRRHREVLEEPALDVDVEVGLEHRRRHGAVPRVTLRPPDDERQVPHAQRRMATLAAVGRRPAPVLDEEQREVALRFLQVVGIQGPEHVVLLDPLVEPVDEIEEERLAPDRAEDVELHQFDTDRWSAAQSRSISDRTARVPSPRLRPVPRAA